MNYLGVSHSEVQQEFFNLDLETGIQSNNHAFCRSNSSKAELGIRKDTLSSSSPQFKRNLSNLLKNVEPEKSSGMNSKSQYNNSPGRSPEKKLGAALQKGVVRSSSSDLCARRKPRPRPVWQMFKDPSEDFNQRIKLRSLLPDKEEMTLQNLSIIPKVSAETADTDNIKPISPTKSKSQDKIGKMLGSALVVRRRWQPTSQSDPRFETELDNADDIGKLITVVDSPLKRPPKLLLKKESEPVKRFIHQKLANFDLSTKEPFSPERKESSRNHSPGEKHQTIFRAYRHKISANFSEFFRGGNTSQINDSTENGGFSLLSGGIRAKSVERARNVRNSPTKVDNSERTATSSPRKRLPLGKIRIKTWFERLPKFTNLLTINPQQIAVEQNQSSPKQVGVPKVIKFQKLPSWDEIFHQKPQTDQQKQPQQQLNPLKDESKQNELQITRRRTKVLRNVINLHLLISAFGT